MNDHKDPLERELEDAFAVDPSPDLQVRIRRRVAGIPVRPKRPFWLAPAVGLVAAAAMVLAVVALRPQKAPPSVVVTPERSTAAATSILEAMPPASVSNEGSATPTRRVTRQQEAVVLQQETVVVLVPPLEPADPFSSSMEPLDFAPLPTLELIEKPLPAMVLSPLAKLEPIKIEPFNLPAREIGVNE
jgi:hypothetical protein